MAHTSSLARRLRLGLIGDGAGTLDSPQLGAASAFRCLDGEIVRQLPVFNAGEASSAALAMVRTQHDHLLVFDAQIPSADGADPEVLAEAVLWLMNQGVDMVVFCCGASENSHALSAALDRCQRLGITLLAGVASAWPSHHAAVLGIAAQTDPDYNLQWLGGDACTVLHGGTTKPSVAVGEVAGIMLRSLSQGVPHSELCAHLKRHCDSVTRRRAS